MIIKGLWPGSKGPETAMLTGDDGQDITDFDAEVAVLPRSTKRPTDDDWLTPTAVEHPSVSVITATFTLDEETLPPGEQVFNVWIRAFLGSTQIVPRVAGQLKRPRF